MTFACPNCEGDVRLSEKACAGCGLSLTLSGLIGHYGGGLIEWFRSYAFIPCPSCGQLVPITAIHCPHADCGQKITVGGVVGKATATPRKHIGDSRRRWRDFILHATPTQKSVVQWLFLLFCGSISAVLVVMTVRGYTEAHEQTAKLTLISLAVFTVLGVLLLPEELISGVSRYASVPVKLALLANYASLTVVMYWVIGRWPGFMLITWFLGSVSVILLVAMFARKLLFGFNRTPVSGSRSYDPSLPQGRSGRYD